MPPLINFSPPAQSWQDYLDTLPPGQTPKPSDMFARWDEPRYICPARPRNGTTEQFAKHTTESSLPGHCKCSTPYMKQGLQGIGERRAYLAWLAEVMSPEESAQFYAGVVSANYDKLVTLAIVPAIRSMVAWRNEIEGAD